MMKGGTHRLLNLPVFAGKTLFFSSLFLIASLLFYICLPSLLSLRNVTPPVAHTVGLTQELAARVQRATDEHSGRCFQWEGHNGNVWNCSKNHLHLKRTKALWQSVDTSLKTLVFTAAAAAAGARGPAVFRAVLFFFARLCNSLQPPKDLNTSQLFLSLIFLSLRTNGLLYTWGAVIQLQPTNQIIVSQHFSIDIYYIGKVTHKHVRQKYRLWNRIIF